MKLKKVKSIKDQQEHQRKYISDLAIKGAKIKNCGKMCSTCAFKLDSPANLEPNNVEAAAQSLVHGQFNCHIETDIDSGHPCAGFMNALQIIEPDRKLIYYTPKNVFFCPYCQEKYGDRNDFYRNRCDRNKSGYTTKVCACGKKFGIIEVFNGTLEGFPLTDKK